MSRASEWEILRKRAMDFALRLIPRSVEEGTTGVVLMFFSAPYRNVTRLRRFGAWKNHGLKLLVPADSAVSS
jgi:hypothetical protein